MIDERIERLINRRLDGALTEEEALELDKAVLRSPQARRLAEQYQRMDALAADALRDALDARTTTPQEAAVRVRASYWPARIVRLAGLGAIAAGVALAVVMVGQLIGPRHPTSDPQPVEPLNVPMVELPDRLQPAPAEPRPTLVIERAWPGENDFTRDILGVFDEQTRSLYLLEANRPGTGEGPMLVNY